MMSVTKPDHYKNNAGKDLFDLWEQQYPPEQFISIMESVADRYIKRHRYKNGVEDLRKAQETIERLIQYHEKTGCEKSVDSLTNEIKSIDCNALSDDEINKLSDVAYGFFKLAIDEIEDRGLFG